MLNNSQSMRSFISATWGALVFGAALITTNAVCVAIARIVFGARGKSTLSADVMIFGVLLGVVYATGASVGYMTINLLLHCMASIHTEFRRQVYSALVAALLTYALALKCLPALRAYFEGIWPMGYLSEMIPWAAFSALVGLVVLGPGRLIARPRAPAEFWDRP